jgi:hypothetical protein
MSTAECFCTTFEVMFENALATLAESSAIKHGKIEANRFALFCSMIGSGRFDHKTPAALNFRGVR